MDKKLLSKIDNLKKIFLELKEQLQIYDDIDGKFKSTAVFAIQKKSEEVIEYAIKINRYVLKSKNIFAISYQESFLKLKDFGVDEKLCEELAKFALFRNKLAHEYLIITPEESVKQARRLVEIFPDYLKNILYLK